MAFDKKIIGLLNPAQCLNDIVQAYSEYIKISEEEKTKRHKIAAWEKVSIEEIRTQTCCHTNDALNIDCNSIDLNKQCITHKYICLLNYNYIGFVVIFTMCLIWRGGNARH